MCRRTLTRSYARTPDSHSASPNVRRIYLLTFVQKLSESLWQMQLLSLYLFAVFGDMRMVGWAEGTQGAIRILAAFSIGKAVDTLPRRPLLYFASCFGLGFHVVCFVVVICPQLVPVSRFAAWLCLLALFAFYQCLLQTLADVMFADSVVSGARIVSYTRRGAVDKAAQICGPLLQIVFFSMNVAPRGAGGESSANTSAPRAASSTDSWDIGWSERTLVPLIATGVAIGGASSLLLLSLDQRSTLGHASDALHVEAPQRDVEIAPEPAPSAEGDKHHQGEAAAAAGPSASGAVALPPEPSAPEEPAPTAATGARLRWSILIFDLARVCSGGLVVKFVGLFFVDAYGATPLGIATMLACVFATSLLAVYATGRVMHRWECLRRGPVCFGLLVVVDTCNFLTAFAPSLPAAAVSWALREGALHSMLELKKSLMMDYTPKSSRGVWNAVQGLQQGVWSGTATVGGYIVHSLGFRADFLMMSWGFFMCTSVWALGVRWTR